MRSSHSTRRKFHVPVVGTGGITFDFPSQPSNAFTLSMAASDNLHIPTDESIHAYAERKGVKTDQQREVERQTNGEEEYVPSKGELAAQLLIEKIADSDEEDHLAKKRKASPPRTPRRPAAARPSATPTKPASVTITAQQWNGLVTLVQKDRQSIADLLTMIEDLEKKTKRLVAITLRDDFQRQFPWDPNTTKPVTADDAAGRAAQKAAAIRSKEAKFNEKKKSEKE